MKPSSVYEDGTIPTPASRKARLDEWTSNTAYCYRLSERIIRKELSAVAATAAKTKGKIDPRTISPDTLALLKMYKSASESWQTVALVVTHESNGASECIALNRPISTSID